MRDWHTVSTERPCEICGKSDWCVRSADQLWSICRRTGTDGGLHKVDKAGVEFWLYRLGDHASPRPTPPPPAQPHVARADSVTLHRVYGSLLAALPLSATHREALRQRGLDETEITRRRYRTLPLRGRADLARRLVRQYGEDVCSTVPGFYVAAHAGQHWWSLAGAAGLLLPVRNLDGHIACLKVRADDPEAGPKYTTISSAKYGGPSPGAPVHVPVHALPRGDVVRVTEGELKADIATARSGVLTVSIAGVTAWRTVLPVLAMLQARRVLLAFDMDWGTNALVARALAQTAEALVEAGYGVVVETWDASQAKGIDDLLAAGLTPTRRQSFHDDPSTSTPLALPDPDRPYHKPLPRLRTTLRGLSTRLRRL